jgi:FixJ family two-component response regulator
MGSRSHWCAAAAGLRSPIHFRFRKHVDKVTSPPAAIYIVDDDDDVRAGLVRLIRSLGIQARAYGSAEQFLAEPRPNAQGCILLDVTMPRITGPQLLERLRDTGNTLPVIVVSARDDDTMRALARDLGATMFLRKPVDDQALIDAINWATGGALGIDP